MGRQVLGIVPARGGSKSIPRKNVQPFLGKPLVAWTIEAALQSRCLVRTIVSTDDPEIAHVAQEWGAEVPFVRPPELAQDDTPGVVPILHALEWLEANEHYEPDMVMCLQPTSPLRTAQDIRAAIQLHLAKKADGVVSVTPVEHHPYWMKRLDAEGRMRDFVTSNPPVWRRQDLPPAYCLNGAIYLAGRDVLLTRNSWYTENTFAYIMPPERSLDIDTPWQWHLAEAILKGRYEPASG
jgi:CMP-N,N'-diacetyllegionaminic acid synthase